MNRRKPVVLEEKLPSSEVPRSSGQSELEAVLAETSNQPAHRPTEERTPSEENESPSERAYRRLMEDARATQRAFCRPPRIDTPEQWQKTVLKGADDHISGRVLIDQLGGEMLVDADTAAVILAMRRGLIDELNLSTASDYMLVDMALMNYANAMRYQRIAGNTAMLIEAEFFGQEPLSKQLRRHEGPYGTITIKGLSVEQHIDHLRGQLVQLAERSQRMAERQIAMLKSRRQEPAAHLEQLEPLKIALKPVQAG